MNNKKRLKIISVIVAILIVIVATHIIRNNTKYSNAKVESLILKGVQKFDNMSNVSIERKNQFAFCKYYYKGNKMKMSVLETWGENFGNLEASIVNLDEGKEYLIDGEKKLIAVQKTSTIDKGIQYELAERIIDKQKTQYGYEYEYIKDETIEGKDCIFIKEQLYNRDGAKEYGEHIGDEIAVRTFWIEKSTGFVIGGAMMPYKENSATPEMIVKNITFGEVVDSDFEIPTGYRIIEAK